MHLQNSRSLLALAAVVLILIAGCSSDKEPEHETLVPSGAGLIVQVQISEILENEQVRQVYEEFAQNSDDAPAYDDVFRSIEEEIGLDLNKLSSVVLFADSSQLTATNDLPPGIIAEGSFDEGELVAALEKAGDDSLSSAEYKGYTVHAGGDGDIAFSLLGPDTLVLGSLGHVRSAIDVREGDRERASGATFDAFSDLDESWARLAFAVPPEAVEELEGSLDQLPVPISMDLFRGIQIVAVGVREISDGVSVQANVDFASESMSSDAADAVDGLLKVIGAFSSDDEIERALENVQVSVDGTRLSVSYEASFADLEEAAGSLADGLPDLPFLTP